MSFTLQAYNLCNLKDTLRWAIEYNEKQDNAKVYVSPENLTHPPHFSYRSLPKKFRDSIVLDIMNSEEFKHPDTHFSSKTESRLNYILNDDVEYDIQTFADVTFRLDWSRQQHIKEYIPEIWDVIAPYYHVSKKRYTRDQSK